jgi:hypothetical protein
MVLWFQFKITKRTGYVSYEPGTPEALHCQNNPEFRLTGMCIQHIETP